MSRADVRQLKRTLRSGPFGVDSSLAGNSALALLERSMSFGHARLAVIRLTGAARTGAPLSEQHWRYCEQAAMQSRDPDLLGLFQQALVVAGRESRKPSPQPLGA